ncbi:hypothetical protein HOP50_10g58990 [Chloropicon primus]|uniref:Uncharacterized protein n=1 Tax=Chloropicon primus TaxID=1764295 RepID=A0A5B8MSP2_9CHLO|nr:hypothetical protein A3770_10p58790 [Chloropicon primus]UPR02573.1 hypothetical protein HOP50_10g58990 [Chloropicon primus]|eukprot:QDZ23361.1 hypothetical protein A3770_10p58790 [Chloropicon primus]
MAQTWEGRNYKGLQSEYNKKFVPFETQRGSGTNHGPKSDYKEGRDHYVVYNHTTSRTDYRAWPTKAVYHGKKHDYRPFNAKFDYDTTYGYDFNDKSDLTAGRYDPDKNINTMRNKFVPESVSETLKGNSTNKEDYVDWRVTSTVEPNTVRQTSNAIHELEFTAKSLYQDSFTQWPLQRTVNKKHEVERSGKRF